MIKKQVISILEKKINVIKSNNKNLFLVGPVKLPVNLYEETVTFQWYCWLSCDQVAGHFCEDGSFNIEKIIETLSSSNLAEMQQSSVLVYGDFENANEAWIRMHSICHTGDIFGSKRCDCGFQLKQSMKMIVEHGNGALLYLANHEGRGIGLGVKALAYLLQEEGFDTVEANLNLGFEDDSRVYTDAIEVLRTLRTKPLFLMTNNPKKLEALRQSGMDLAGRIPLWGDKSEYNEQYLQTKVQKSGHLAELEEIEQEECPTCNND